MHLLQPRSWPLPTHWYSIQENTSTATAVTAAVSATTNHDPKLPAAKACRPSPPPLHTPQPCTLHVPLQVLGSLHPTSLYCTAEAVGAHTQGKGPQTHEQAQQPSGCRCTQMAPRHSQPTSHPGTHSQPAIHATAHDHTAHLLLLHGTGHACATSR